MGNRNRSAPVSGQRLEIDPELTEVVLRSKGEPMTIVLKTTSSGSTRTTQ